MEEYGNVLALYTKAFDEYAEKRECYLGFPNYNYNDSDHTLFEAEEYEENNETRKLKWECKHTAPCNGYILVRGWTKNASLELKINDKTFTYGWSILGSYGATFFPVKKGDEFIAIGVIRETGGEFKEIDLQFFPSLVDIKPLHVSGGPDNTPQAEERINLMEKLITQRVEELAKQVEVLKLKDENNEETRINALEELIHNQEKEILLLSDKMQNCECLLKSYNPYFHFFDSERHDYVTVPDYKYDDNEHHLFKNDEYVRGVLSFCNKHKAPCNGYFFVTGKSINSSSLSFKIKKSEDSRYEEFIYSCSNAPTQNAIFFPVKEGIFFRILQPQSVSAGEVKDFKFFPAAPHCEKVENAQHEENVNSEV